MTLDLLLRVSVVLAAGWVLARSLPRATAATRSLVWQASLAAVLVAPLAAPLVPQVTIPASPRLLETARLAFAMALSSADQFAGRTSDGIDEHATAGRAAPAGTAPIPGVLAGAVDEVSVSDKGRTIRLVSGTGTLMVVVWFIAGWLITLIKVRAAAPAPLPWQMELGALCQRFAVHRRVRVGIMREGGSPLAAGIWRPAILLPATAVAWTPERRRAVFLHELAHIRRHDCLMQVVAQAACALYWFHPLVWMAAAQLRRERERACDDEVLLGGIQGSDYASHLLQIARELPQGFRPTAALAMARPTELEGRLLAVLADRRRVPMAGSRAAATAAIACLALLTLGATTTSSSIAATAAYGRTLESGSANAFLITPNGMSTRERQRAAKVRAQAAATLHASVDESARERAVADLAADTHVDNVRSLERALDDPSPDVREKATLAIAFRSGPDAIPALLRALGDRNAQVREKAAIGLALRRDDRIIGPLRAAMDDPDAQVREKVAIALGTSGDPRAADVLTHALHDPDPQVREKAAAALVLLGVASR
jgi:beta-lactamase regulating signal transducer with metallopeptidase domain